MIFHYLYGIFYFIIFYHLHTFDIVNDLFVEKKRKIKFIIFVWLNQYV